MNDFVKATRKIARLRIGLSGPSGSGKTYSALLLAHGLGGKIALLDTERRASLYAEKPIKELDDKPFDYNLVEMSAPYEVDRYIDYIRKAERSGHDILIIDSLSHAWAGEGGILSLVERSGKSTFHDGWRVATPKQNALVDAIINSNMHIIITLRTKTEWVTQTNEKGKTIPKKVGTTPVQRDNLEYEFTLFMTLDNESHIAHASKDNTGLFDQKYMTLLPDHGKQLRKWLDDGNLIAQHSAAADKEEKVKLFMDKISNAPDMALLKIAFQDAYNYALSLRDDVLIKRFTNAKDAAKKVLLDEAEAKPMPPESQEEMDKSWDEFKQEAE